MESIDTISKKYLILMRHGERIDENVEEKCNQKLHCKDPELTKRGYQLSKEMGTKIMNFLNQITNIETLNKSLTIEDFMFVTSPFSRAIQTAKGVVHSIINPENDQESFYSQYGKFIKVENLFAESYTTKYHSGYIFKDFVSLYQNADNGSSIFEAFEGEKLHFYNFSTSNPLENLPTEYEDELADVERRMIAGLKVNFEEFKNCKVLVIVSHATPIEVMFNSLIEDKELHIDHKFINYCESFLLQRADNGSISNCTFINKLSIDINSI